MFKITLFLCLLSGFAGRALAAPADPGNFSSVTQTFGVIITEIERLIPRILNDPELSDVGLMFWQTFAVILLVNLVVKFKFRGITLEEAFGVILLIGLVRAGMMYFGDITSAFWGWSEGVAQGIQRIALGNTDLMFIPRFTYDIYKSLSFSDYSILDGLNVVIALVVMNVVGVVLGILSILAVAWGLWGYAIAKMVGWMFVPFIMFERLAWIFDGWLRFFFGFLIYGIMARANLVLIAIALRAYFGLGSYSVPANSAFLFDLAHPAEAFGLLAFLTIGIFALISTGQFASAVAGGVGGFSSGVRSMVLGLAMGRGRS